MRVNLIYNFYMSDSFDGVDRSRLVMVNKFFIILLSLFWGIGCNSSVVVPEDLVVSDVTTGWLDVGFDELGRNKLVPTISFHIKNVSYNKLRTLQLNGIFRRCLPAYAGSQIQGSEVSLPGAALETCTGEEQEWGNAFIRAVGRQGLEPDASVGPFTMQSDFGYTGEQPRRDMFQHRDFIDSKVEIFVKHRAEEWLKLKEYQIERQLLTQ